MTNASNLKFPPQYQRLSLDLLNTCLSRVSFYSSWRSLDPGPDYPVDDRFAALPALTKKDIRAHFPRGMIPADLDLERALAAREVSLVETSGTTADKITNIWNQKWWDASEKASWQLNAHTAGTATGDHREAILVNPRNVGIASDTADLPFEKRCLSRFLYLNEKTDPLAWTEPLMERMIAEINDYQPAVLEANPSYLARLCRYITARRRMVFQPGVITFTYEFPSALHYRQIRRVFSSPAASSYGTTETGYVFMQCEAGKFHQNSDFCRVDFQPFRDEYGGPLLGRILVTPLNNPWSFMLRFDVGDLVRLDPEGKCACGRQSGIILSSIDGRYSNLTLTSRGRPVTLQELDNALNIVEGIDEYRLVQTASEAFELHLAVSAADMQATGREAVEILHRLYGEEASIAVIRETSLAPEKSGKYQLAGALFPIEIEKYLA